MIVWCSGPGPQTWGVTVDASYTKLLNKPLQSSILSASSATERAGRDLQVDGLGARSLRWDVLTHTLI